MVKGCVASVLLVFAVASAAMGAGADDAAPDASCAEAVARKVQAHYEAISDWQASFTQTRVAVSFGGGPAVAEPERSGTVVLAKPGRMRWSYEKPDPSLFVSDGSVVWTYDPLLGEAQRMHDAGGLLSGAAVRFLMGQGDLLDSFRVSARDCAARPVHLELVPKKPESYERLGLDVDPETGRVARSTVTDLFGNRTTVAFEDVHANTKPDPSLFHFEPPDGVKVVDVEPSS